MPIDTAPALTAGKCDWCPGRYEAGEDLGVLPDNTVACSNCVEMMRSIETPQ